jgi:hypothetical protein
MLCRAVSTKICVEFMGTSNFNIYLRIKSSFHVARGYIIESLRLTHSLINHMSPSFPRIST